MAVTETWPACVDFSTELYVLACILKEANCGIAIPLTHEIPG